jgi:hypothetical protein
MQNLINTNEEILEKSLVNEPWFMFSKLCDLEKIKKRTISLKHFFNDQKQLNDYCTEKVFNHVLSKKNLFESKNCRSLVRTGVPCKYMKDYLIKLYSIEYNETAFTLKYDSVFKGFDPSQFEDFVPYLTGSKDLHQSLPVHFLNDKGIIELKELMWMFINHFPTIEFSPLIIKVVSLCLMFCGQKNAYFIMKKLLEVEYNINETFKIRWHFRFTFNDNSKIISSVIEALDEIAKSGKTVFHHFEQISFPVNKLIEDMVYGFFLDYLSFEGVCRLFSFFMLEGVKSLYRVAYAVFKQIKGDLLKISNPDEILKVAREKAKEIVDLNALFQTAYSFKLTRNNNKFDFQKPPEKDNFLGKRTSFYLPSIGEKSSILSDSEIIKLWSILPDMFRIRDGKKIFSTEKDGFSLSTIYGLNENHSYDSTILVLVQTVENEAVGIVLSNMLKITNYKYQRPLNAYIYKLRPSISSYEPHNADEIVYCDNEFLMIGGGPNGPAIMIDKDLKKGYSNPDNCFKMPIMSSKNKGNFEVDRLEIYLLS